MNAALPKNPFSTRFTRPEAVAFQCPAGNRLAADSLAEGESQKLAPLTAGETSAKGSLPTEHGVDDAAALCCRIVEQLKSAKYGLIVGPHGSGKTTLLYSLMPFLVAAFQIDGHARVRRMQLTMPLVDSFWSRYRHARDSARVVVDCLSGLPPGSLLVIDGVEQLRSSDLRSLLRKLRRRDVLLLATSHAKVDGLSVLHQTVVDVMLIQSLAARLLEDASPSVVDLVSRELQCRNLNARTNVRDLWFELYDIVQDELLVDSTNLKDGSDGGSIICSHGSQLASDFHR